MKALILRSDPDAAIAIAQTMIDNDFQISCVENFQIACALVRADSFDVLISDEAVDGHLTHALLAAAARKNPALSAIMVTDRTGAQEDPRLESIACLHAVVGTQVAAKLIGALAMTAINCNSLSAPARQAATQSLRTSASNWDGRDTPSQSGETVDQAAIDADITALAAALDAVQPADAQTTTRPVAPLERFDQPAVHAPHIAQVSIIGEGRHIPAGLQ
ncbi:hypothetical protein SAMN04488005_0865 [Yoonia tamlensis]|uniref:Response regulatory domain-containing protein n=1 Tax=Yoonia tamlensis TaxID=390270 RepID=A0A1I6G111_9RHOB|nr:hypothetical protein [Yoonia tamlensis]SFR35747.1 hypothetical protein SAMN04488005_0865 [Yoonia tamlensis]